ncbi:MAG: HU family DNA-binding protein [Clostridiales bacterium]|jgi:DNA-binding protein HU|nr:HU family DNA-binding protein [Clostridiales bacterium]
MKKSELIEAIAEKAGLTKVEAGKALDATFEVIANQLEKGEKVPVAGFGTFKLSSRAAREGRNPKTGETIKIAASTSVSFKAGTALKEKVNK